MGSNHHHTWLGQHGCDVALKRRRAFVVLLHVPGQTRFLEFEVQFWPKVAFAYQRSPRATAHVSTDIIMYKHMSNIVGLAGA